MHGGPIVARVHEPVETIGLTKTDVAALTDQVRQIIASELADLNGRF